MLRIDLHTLPTDFSSLPLDVIGRREEPAFTRYEPDYQLLFSLAGKYAAITNFLILGRGGSVSGFRAIYEALARYKTTKRVFIVDTVDPDYLQFVRRKCLPDDTLVIAVSKSGETVDVLEDLLLFPEYRKIVVTENREGALGRYAAVKGLEVVPHPPIGGRFSLGTESALLPAALLYIDVKSIVGGMRAVFRQCRPENDVTKNPALRLAAALFLAEQQGLTEVYAPFYSKALAATSELWTQLLHETVCKDGQGQSFFFVEAPECQHFLNQKFFGGPRRMVGLLTRVAEPEYDVRIPDDHQVGELDIRGLPLAGLVGERLRDALFAEYRGVLRAADDAGIPSATITLDILNPGTFGELVAFWMYVAVYSAWLRGVEPFGQPDVEASKRLALEERRRMER